MTIPEFQRYKKQGKKLTVVTAYDALFTRIVEQAGLDVILVGDSLGMVVQGEPNTLSVTMEDMLYHTRIVARAAQRALVIGDMPFMSYQTSMEDAVRNAGRLLQAGAAAVKIEGGAPVIDRVEAMTRFGIPVMGHVGMTPAIGQSIGRVYGQGKRPGRSGHHSERCQGLGSCRSVCRGPGMYALRAGSAYNRSPLDSHDRDRSGAGV